jgi:hypothetical protein
MDTTNKVPVTPATAAAGEDLNALEAAFQLYTSGIERLAGVQKSAINSATEHNAEMMKALKKQASAAPGLLMVDLATNAFDRFAETQKGAIDLIVEQTQTLAGLVKERRVNATKAIDEGVTKAQDAINQSLAAQKTALDYTSKQTKTAFETAKQQFGYAGTPIGTAADSMQRGMEVVVEAQKDLLEVLKVPVQVTH